MHSKGRVAGNRSIRFDLIFSQNRFFAHLYQLSTVVATSAAIEGQNYESHRLSNMRNWPGYPEIRA